MHFQYVYVVCIMWCPHKFARLTIMCMRKVDVHLMSVVIIICIGNYCYAILLHSV